MIWCHFVAIAALWYNVRLFVERMLFGNPPCVILPVNRCLSWPSDGCKTCRDDRLISCNGRCCPWPWTVLVNQCQIRRLRLGFEAAISSTTDTGCDLRLCLNIGPVCNSQYLLYGYKCNEVKFGQMYSDISATTAYASTPSLSFPCTACENKLTADS